MEPTDHANPVCRSVFKDGGETTSKKQFTGVWIELINSIERNKKMPPPAEPPPSQRS